MEAGKGLGIQI